MLVECADHSPFRQTMSAMNPTLSVRARVLTFAPLTIISLAMARPLDAQQKNPDLAPFMISDPAAEVALARTAAPHSITDSATVLVLVRNGFVEAHHGSNGFTCAVLRGFDGGTTDPNFWNSKIRSPVCLNPAASRTVLPGLMNAPSGSWRASIRQKSARNEAGLCRARIHASRGGGDGVHAVAPAELSAATIRTGWST